MGMRIFLFVLIFLFSILVVSYVWYLVDTAKKQVNKIERKDVVICDKHGLIPSGATVQLFDDDFELETKYSDGTHTKAKVKMCPICLREKVKIAQERFGK